MSNSQKFGRYFLGLISVFGIIFIDQIFIGGFYSNSFLEWNDFWIGAVLFLSPLTMFLYDKISHGIGNSVSILFILAWFLPYIFSGCGSESGTSSSESSSSESCTIAGFYSGKDHIGLSATIEIYEWNTFMLESSAGSEISTVGDWSISGNGIVLYSEGSKMGNAHFDSNCNLIVGDNTWKRIR